MTKLLSRLLRWGSAAVLACTVLCVNAQIRSFDMERDNGITWQHDHTLTQHGFTYTTAKAKFGVFIGKLEAEGWSQAEVMGLYEFCVAWNDDFLRGCGYFSETPQLQNLTGARVSIKAPPGGFRLNYPCWFNQGIYEGAGAGNYSGSPGQSTGGTGLYLDNATWYTSRSPERFCLKSITWGMETGYAECFTVKHFRFEGGRTSQLNDPSFIAAGMGIWDSGEASGVEYCYAFGFNTYGFMNVRGTPSRFDQCSSFSNGIFGFGLIGNDLSTITIVGPSGDDNGALVGVRSGYGRPGGGTVTIVGAKSESGKRTPYRKQKLFDGQGAGNWTINGAWVHAIDAPDCVISCDFQTYNGQIAVTGLRHDGYTVALRLTRNGTTTNYASPGSITPYSFTAIETGLVSSTRTMTPGGGTIPPPTTCTWIAGTETCGACNNGKQDCTTPYVSSVAGCTPTGAKPADLVVSKTCTVTPPTGALFSQANLTNSDPAKLTAMNVTGVKRAVFTAANWTKIGTGSYPYLLGLANDQGVQALPSGAIVGWGVNLTASGPLVAGSSVTITVTFTNPVTVTSLFNRATSRDAFQGTIGKLELFGQ